MDKLIGFGELRKIQSAESKEFYSGKITIKTNKENIILKLDLLKAAKRRSSRDPYYSVRVYKPETHEKIKQVDYFDVMNPTSEFKDVEF
jgi:hypothetical protein